MNYEHKQIILNSLSMYLNMNYGVSTSKNFKCIAPDHEDKNPSMTFKDNKIFCACGWNCGRIEGDIFNLIGIEYNLNTFREQYQKACLLLGYEDEFNSKKYKRHMQEIKNNIIDLNVEHKKKYNRFNEFCNKLLSKKKEMIIIMDLVNDKNSTLYQDYKFKVDYITRFLDNNLECNSQTLENIKDFNNDFDMAYRNFKEYFLDIM